MSSPDADKVIAHMNELRILVSLRGGRGEQIRHSLNRAGIPLLRCIQEIAYNLLYSNLPVKPNEYQVLKRYQAFIRHIGKKHLSEKTLKKQIFSHAEVVPFIIRPALRAYKIQPLLQPLDQKTSV